jgi:hypothetical protein
MGSKVSVPGPSAEERELQKRQAELLAQQSEIIQEQRAQNRILLPFLAQQEGFDVTVDDNGVVTAITQRPEETARRARESEITQLLNERSLKALKGELPVDPALERDLEAQERELKNQLSAKFGPGYETSSPAIETLGEFFRTAEVLRSGARTGQLTLAEQLGITREQQQQFSRQASQDVLRTSAVGDPLTIAGAFGQSARGYGQAQIPFIQQRQMQTQASIANAQSSAGILGAGIGLLGAFISDEDAKTDLVRVSQTIDGIPIYAYTHRSTGERMIGVLSKDVEKVRPGSVGRRLGMDVVQYRDLGHGYRSVH